MDRRLRSISFLFYSKCNVERVKEKMGVIDFDLEL